MSKLRFRAVELTTLNIALLGRQPKFLFMQFSFLCINFYLLSALSDVGLLCFPYLE